MGGQIYLNKNAFFATCDVKNKYGSHSKLFNSSDFDFDFDWSWPFKKRILKKSSHLPILEI